MATHFVPKIRHQTIVIILRQKGFNSICHFLLCNTYLHPMLLCSRQNAIQHESSVALLHVYNSRRRRCCCCCCQIKLNHTAISLHPSTEWVNFSAIFCDQSRPLFLYIYLFSSYDTVHCMQMCDIKVLLMTGFELWISRVWSDHSTNWATTTARFFCGQMILLETRLGQLHLVCNISR